MPTYNQKNDKMQSNHITTAECKTQCANDGLAYGKWEKLKQQ